MEGEGTHLESIEEVGMEGDVELQVKVPVPSWGLGCGSPLGLLSNEGPDVGQLALDPLNLDHLDPDQPFSFAYLNKKNAD